MICTVHPETGKLDRNGILARKETLELPRTVKYCAPRNRKAKLNRNEM
jgi:hypothetical protein